MKRLLISAFVTAALLFTLVLPGQAQGFTFIFDENGNGTLNGQPLSGSVMFNPSNTGLPNNEALTYIFGPIVGNVIGGDVLVYEDFIGGTLSDAIRFTNADGVFNGLADRLIFYSDNTDGVEDLADTGFPTNLGTGPTGNPVLEGPDGRFVYNAGNVYIGISDAEAPVPEPGPLAMILGFALSGSLFVFRRLKRQ